MIEKEQNIADATRCILRCWEDYANDECKKSIAAYATLIAYTSLKDCDIPEAEAHRILTLVDDLLSLY